MGESEARCRRLDEENACLRAEGDRTQVELDRVQKECRKSAERVQKEFGNSIMTAATLQRENGVMDGKVRKVRKVRKVGEVRKVGKVGKVARLTAAPQVYWDGDIRGRALRVRSPFVNAPFDSCWRRALARSQCSCSLRRARSVTVMLIGTATTSCFPKPVNIGGSLSVRGSVFRHRGRCIVGDERFEQFQLGAGIFDGEAANRSRLVEQVVGNLRRISDDAGKEGESPPGVL